MENDIKYNKIIQRKLIHKIVNFLLINNNLKLKFSQDLKMKFYLTIFKFKHSSNRKKPINLEISFLIKLVSRFNELLKINCDCFLKKFITEITTNNVIY